MERLAPGAVVLRRFAVPEEAALLAALRRGDRRRAVAPHGHAGRLPHVGGDDELRRARLGHRRDGLPLRRRSIPESGRPLAAHAGGVRARRARRGGSAPAFDGFVPDACLVNRYEPGARLSLHQDRDERDFAAPIVSVSLGLPAVFLFGGDEARRPGACACRSRTATSSCGAGRRGCAITACAAQGRHASPDRRLPLQPHAAQGGLRIYRGVVSSFSQQAARCADRAAARSSRAR